MITQTDTIMRTFTLCLFHTLKLQVGDLVHKVLMENVEPIIHHEALMNKVLKCLGKNN